MITFLFSCGVSISGVNIFILTGGVEATGTRTAGERKAGACGAGAGEREACGTGANEVGVVRLEAEEARVDTVNVADDNNVAACFSFVAVSGPCGVAITACSSFTTFFKFELNVSGNSFVAASLTVAVAGIAASVRAVGAVWQGSQLSDADTATLLSPMLSANHLLESLSVKYPVWWEAHLKQSRQLCCFFTLGDN